MTLGHAGAIIECSKETRESKVKALKKAGVVVADMYPEVGRLIKEAIGRFK